MACGAMSQRFSRRLSARVDENQPPIVRALHEHIGENNVLSLAGMGKGCPDLLVGLHGVNYLLEVKNPNRPPCKQKLNFDQTLWHGTWAGQVAIVHTFDEVCEVIGLKVGK